MSKLFRIEGSTDPQIPPMWCVRRKIYKKNREAQVFLCLFFFSRLDCKKVNKNARRNNAERRVRRGAEKIPVRKLIRCVGTKWEARSGG